MNPICPYCDKPSVESTGKDVYPHRPDLAQMRFFSCFECDAYVGRHRNGKSLGSLANKPLRKLRSACHVIFDRRWKTKSERQLQYRKLAESMGIQIEQCHFGMFNEEQCSEALEHLA